MRLDPLTLALEALDKAHERVTKASRRLWRSGDEIGWKRGSRKEVGIVIRNATINDGYVVLLCQRTTYSGKATGKAVYVGYCRFDGLYRIERNPRRYSCNRKKPAKS